MNGAPIDITSSYDYSSLTINGMTTSFSPFFLVRTGTHISPAFDQAHAYKSGSTVPIKIQVMNNANSNISSSSLFVHARGLLRIQTSTSEPVANSGNSNPDSNFRFAGDGYIFNLSTKGLAQGRYSLNMSVGADTRFVYNVTFDVK